jgi:NADH dehydrogenase/NADH:ubiquinone oxidoreductase subunit G
MRITIDGIELQAEEGETILSLARKAGIEIPALCYHESSGGQGICRLCLVEVTAGGRSRLVASCTYPVSEELSVRTSTPAIERIRRNLVLLLYRRAPDSDYVRELYQRYGSPAVTVVDPQERCIMCRLCVRACEQVGSYAISAVSRGTGKRIGTPYDAASADCIGCGACAAICPTGAIEVRESGDQRRIWHRDFQLERCAVCGQPFAPRQLLSRLQQQPDLSADENICPSCRQRRIGQALAGDAPAF